MPVVNPETGEPVSDAPDQADESLAGGVGRGENVSATDTGEHSSITTGPDNEREAQPGATLTDGSGQPDSSNSTGGV